MGFHEGATISCSTLGTKSTELMPSSVAGTLKRAWERQLGIQHISWEPGKSNREYSMVASLKKREGEIPETPPHPSTCQQLF